MLQLERKYFRNVKVLHELSYFKLSNALKTLKLTSEYMLSGKVVRIR